MNFAYQSQYKFDQNGNAELSPERRAQAVTLISDAARRLKNVQSPADFMTVDDYIALLDFLDEV